MAVRSFSQTITTTRAPITISVDDRIAGCTIWLYGEYTGTSNNIAIGGDDVTMANGIHLYAHEKLGPFTLQDGETMYAITDQVSGLDLRVLVIGN